MFNDVKHLLMCSLVVCIPCLEKCLFKSFAHFFNGLSGFLVVALLTFQLGCFSFDYWIVRVLYIFYIQVPYEISKYFLPFRVLTFHFLDSVP